MKTERDWLNADDPRVLFLLVARQATPRQRRLLACAGARVFWRQMGPLAREAVVAAERCADDPAGYPAMIEAGKALTAASTTFVGEADISVSLTSSDLAGRYCTLADPARAAEEIVRQLARRKERRALGCHMLREVFGNPFQPPAFDSAWVGVSAVAELAQHIHDEHAFERMPDLGDALEAAGCIDRLILDHCCEDDPNRPHARGCWVLEGCLQFPEHAAPPESPAPPQRAARKTEDRELDAARAQAETMECADCAKRNTLTVLRVKKAGPNQGRLFFKCNQCDWFMWWNERGSAADSGVQAARSSRAPCAECGKTVSINRVKRAGPNHGRLFQKCNHCGAFSWLGRE